MENKAGYKPIGGAPGHLFGEFLLLCPGLSDVDIPIEILELDFLAASVDCPANIFIDLHTILAAFATIIFHGLLWSSRLHFHIKVTVNLAIISAQAHIGFQVGRKRDVNIAIE